MVGAMVTTHEPIQVLDGREATSVVTVTRLAPLGIRGKCVGQSFRHGLRPPRRVFLFGALQSWSLGIEPDLLPLNRPNFKNEILQAFADRIPRSAGNHFETVNADVL